MADLEDKKGGKGGHVISGRLFFIMKIQADVKITILDGDEKGKTFTFSNNSETDTVYTRFEKIERVRLEYSFIHPIHVDDNRGISIEDFEEAMEVLQKGDI